MDSFIGWIGGKKLLRNEICRRFPDDFKNYVEVFGGAGWVLFNSLKHAETEVYNDINSNLVNLFRCVKHHPEAIDNEMALLLNSREIFNSFKKTDLEVLTDIQKAARYFYLIKTSYGCKIGTFGSKPKNINSFDVLMKIHKRLERVVIENKSFEAVIKQYDKEKTLFYCDPPYFGAEGFYDTGEFIFDKTQHIKLKDTLCEIKGKFILSYNDCDFIREMYRGFIIEEIERQNNLASKHGIGKVYKELIIRNY